MSIGTGSLIEISLAQLNGGSTFLNVWQYEVTEIASTFAAVLQAEAWWNHVKTAYRGIAPAGWGTLFQSVTIRELNNPAGELAEFTIPSNEASGTRAGLSSTQGAATFMACGIRLTVPSRVTRPGQKRLGFVTESDLDGDRVGSAFVGVAQTLMNTMTAPMTLGSPAIGTVLLPVVCRKDVTGTVTAHQAVIGYVVNPFLTSQVSRKYGRGI